MYVDIGMDLAVRASQVLGVFDQAHPRIFAARAGRRLPHRGDRRASQIVCPHAGIRADARLLDQIQRIHPCPALRRRKAAMIPRFLIKAKGEIHE